MNNLINKTKSRIPHKHITHSCISQDEQGVQDVEVVINEEVCNPLSDHVIPKFLQSG